VDLGVFLLYHRGLEADPCASEARAVANMETKIVEDLIWHLVSLALEISRARKLVRYLPSCLAVVRRPRNQGQKNCIVPWLTDPSSVRPTTTDAARQADCNSWYVLDVQRSSK
jgi:hypothetical protein